MEKEQTVTFGPYGCYEPPRQWNDGTYGTVRELIIYSGDFIYSIQVVYDDEGKPVTGKKHGGRAGRPHRVLLNYPSEYLVAISGSCGYYQNANLVVKSLTLHSNKKQYGPYGREEEIDFTTPLSAGKIVGFFGRKGDCLDAIGIHVKPCS